MRDQIESSKLILEEYRARRAGECTVRPDRLEIVAHAMLSALVHHWPSRTTADLSRLLSDTLEIKEIEHSRWMTQRRIAIAKLAASRPEFGSP